MLPKTPLRCKIAREKPREDTVCIQTCKRGIPLTPRLACFINNGVRQMSFYAANADFRHCARLTGFPSARNIIRIRTK
jgi:hypothetical protein